MNQTSSKANKEEWNFYNKVVEQLEKIDISHGYRPIPFPKVKYQLGMYFRLKKKETMLVLKELEQQGKVKIIPFRGIKILNNGGKNE